MHHPSRLLATIALMLGLAAPAARALEPNGVGRQPPTGRWYATQLHAHSRHSDGIHPLSQMVQWAKEGGLDALCVSDHQTDKHLLDPAWQNAGKQGVIMIPGYEWTRTWRKDGSSGPDCHINVWGIKQGQNHILPPEYPLNDALDFFAAKGLTVGVNHPFDPRFPWSNDDLTGTNAMEVWQWNFGQDTPFDEVLPDDVRVTRHAMKDFYKRNGRAIAMWMRNMQAGRHITPLATCDFHVIVQKLESPCTLIWSETPTADGILAGLRAGRVSLVSSPKGPRVEIDADADHDGIFETIAGGTVPAGTRLRVRATNAKHLKLAFWRGDGEVAHYDDLTGGTFTRTFTAQPGVYFARLDKADVEWDALQGLTGAIYVP